MAEEAEKEELKFDDIARLKNRDIQMILREVQGKDIALALKAAPEKLRDRVFDNVSNRVATMIRDEMKLVAAAKIADVKEMRSVITTIARGLAASGEIAWPPSAGTARTADTPRAAKHADQPRPRPKAQARRFSRRTAIQVIGGLGSAIVLVALVMLVGRLSNPLSTGVERSASPKRVVGSLRKSGDSGQTRAPSRGTGGSQPKPQTADPQQRAAGSGANQATGAEPGETGSQPASGQGGASESAPASTQGSDSGAPSGGGGAQGAGGSAGSSGTGSGQQGDGTGDGQPSRQQDQALKPGDRLQTKGMDPAVYQMADGSGTLEIEPHSSLQVARNPEAHDGEAEPPRLDMRLGNIKVDVTDPELEVTSPLVSVKATEGSQYRLRVVMDATTTVTVESGVVWLTPTVGDRGGLVVLQPGDEALITPLGRVSVKKQP